MISKKELESAINLYRSNDYWREVYDNAPGKAKIYKGLSFLNSYLWDRGKNKQKEEVCHIMDSLEKELNLEELRYLLKHQGHNPGVMKWKKLIAEKEAEEENHNKK